MASRTPRDSTTGIKNIFVLYPGVNLLEIYRYSITVQPSFRNLDMKFLEVFLVKCELASDRLSVLSEMGLEFF